ncbi:hypothetical protein L1887_59664 [Cichorium endivia]|nr:hypothetical protein L1887_59664 [Cichorium endivia]
MGARYCDNKGCIECGTNTNDTKTERGTVATLGLAKLARQWARPVRSEPALEDAVELECALSRLLDVVVEAQKGGGMRVFRERAVDCLELVREARGVLDLVEGGRCGAKHVLVPLDEARAPCAKRDASSGHASPSCRSRAGTSMAAESGGRKAEMPDSPEAVRSAAMMQSPHFDAVSGAKAMRLNKASALSRSFCGAKHAEYEIRHTLDRDEPDEDDGIQERACPRSCTCSLRSGYPLRERCHGQVQSRYDSAWPSCDEKEYSVFLGAGTPACSKTTPVLVARAADRPADGKGIGVSFRPEKCLAMTLDDIPASEEEGLNRVGDLFLSAEARQGGVAECLWEGLCSFSQQRQRECARVMSDIRKRAHGEALTEDPGGALDAHLFTSGVPVALERVLRRAVEGKEARVALDDGTKKRGAEVGHFVRHHGEEVVVEVDELVRGSALAR